MQEQDIDEQEDVGDKNATAGTVLEYLVAEHGLERVAANDLLIKHARILQRGVDLRSKAYYVGDEILKAEQS